MDDQSGGAPNNGEVLSTSRTMAQLMAQPSNRSCADCRVTLLDASQVYLSLSPLPNIPKARYNHFLSNHVNFCPPDRQPSQVEAEAVATTTKSSDKKNNLPIDPALLATTHTGGHGVFVCAMCAAAHKLLGPSITLVHSVQDTAQWTPDRVQFLVQSGGNARARTVLESYLPPHWSVAHPTSTSSIADRLTFIRAKYEALAFVLPPSGPLGTRAWRAIVDLHPEWKGLWGAESMGMSDLNLSGAESIRHLLVDRNAHLPNRLVDHFCVVDHSPYLEHAFAKHVNSSQIKTPEDICLAPVVTDCFPGRDAYEDTPFPEHIGSFVCPEGYRPSSFPHAPTFFTFVLTCADGNRLYGGALRVYDKSYGPRVLKQSFANSRITEKMPNWLKDDSSSLGAPDVIYMPKILVILSHYPFFDLWRKALLALYRIVLIEAPLPIERFIANFCSEVPVPPPGRVNVRFGFTANDVWSITRPPENVLPMANFSFRPLFASLSLSSVMVLVGCLLQENRVVLLSQHYALLTPVAEALVSLIFPFRWQGLFVPITPYSMLDILDSPVPFLLGLHSRYLTDVPPSRRPRGVVFVDLDKDTVHLGFDDLQNDTVPRGTPSLPEKDAMKLRSKLAVFAAPAYLVPDSNRAGKITYGDEKPMPYIERELYARMPPENSVHNRARRRDLFSAVDKAYTENELMKPMTGFLSEQGQYHGGDTTKNSEPQRRKVRIMLGFKKRQSSMRSVSNSDDFDDSSDDEAPSESLLDLHDPRGFSTMEIRDAFLRFFVSIMRDYRTFMVLDDFNADAFVSNLNLSPGNRNFVYNMTQTQLFQRFIQERRESPDDPECLFFDESINAKINRSRFTTLANLGRGGRRETGFIDDKSKIITDVYTPPPPSNLGLPDRTYQYGSFPELDPSLFGKTREPRKWSVKSSSIRTLRQNVVPSARGSSWKTGSKVGAKSRMSTPKEIVNNTKKHSVKTLEGALEFLSLPFVSPGEITDHIDHVSFRRATSETDVPDRANPLRKSLNDISSAEEVVLNARRKVSILLSIFADFQAVSRGYLTRHASITNENSYPRTEMEIEEDAVSRSQRTASEVILRMVLIFKARRRLLQFRGAAILIQAIFRGRRAELIFGLIREAVGRFQARARGWLVRRRLRRMVGARMRIYGPEIFTLWKMAHTSLAYRTKFWPYFKSTSLLGLGIIETEMQSLAKELDLRSEVTGFVNPDVKKLIRESKLFGMSTQVLRLCMTTDSSSGGERDSAGASLSNWSDATLHQGDTSSEAAARVAAERTQIYEKLSSLSNSRPDSAEKLYDSFNVPLKDKQRKGTLAKAVWTKFRYAEESVKLMVLLFPELAHSTNIKFSKPSSKGVRRIRSSEHIPAPLDETRWSHTFMDRRIRKNLAEVAAAALLHMVQVPHVQGSERWMRFKDMWSRAVTLAQGQTSWKQCRLDLMRNFVHQEKAPAINVKPDQHVPSPGRSTTLSSPATSPMMDMIGRPLFPDILISEQ